MQIAQASIICLTGRRNKGCDMHTCCITKQSKSPEEQQHNDWFVSSPWLNDNKVHELQASPHLTTHWRDRERKVGTSGRAWRTAWLTSLKACWRLVNFRGARAGKNQPPNFLIREEERSSPRPSGPSDGREEEQASEEKKETQTEIETKREIEMRGKHPDIQYTSQR